MNYYEQAIVSVKTSCRLFYFFGGKYGKENIKIYSNDYNMCNFTDADIGV